MSKFAEPQARSASSPVSPKATPARRRATAVRGQGEDQSAGVRQGVTEVWNPEDVRFVQVNEATRDFIPVEGATPRDVAAGSWASEPLSQGESRARENEESKEALPARLPRSKSDVGLRAWLSKLAGLEGSLADWRANPANARDRGGETNYGLTWAAYQRMRPAATKEEFASLSEEQVMSVARGLFRFYGTDRIEDPGIALLLADSFWGGFSKDALNRALVRTGKRGSAIEGPLNDETIAEINAASPEEFSQVYLEERQEYHRRIIERRPEQRTFLTGWQRRFRTRWIQGELLRGSATVAARWLNGQSLEVLQGQLAQLSKEEIRVLHEAAGIDPGLGRDSRLFQVTSRAEESEK